MHSRTTPRRQRVLRCVGAAALAGGTLAVLSAGAASASTATFTSSNAGAFTELLTANGRSVYVLATEKGGTLHCTSAACLKDWHPYEVASTVKSVTRSAGVKGTFGFVKRTSKLKQVTFNGYPLYTYSGDTTKAHTNGEALDEFGGRWYLVHAPATKATSTQYVPLIQAANIPGFKNVLQVGSSSLSLYLLTSEQNGNITCAGQCLNFWPPLLVGNSTTSITLGAGVKGKIGFVARSGKKQVTYNSFPVYTYYTDTANTSQGQGINADGGTWYLVNAAATSAAASPVT